MTLQFEKTRAVLAKLTPDRILTVRVGDEWWPHQFFLREPLEKAAESKMSATLRERLPVDYVEFCCSIANGGDLYRDARYGQWGFRVYGLDEIENRQEFWQASLANHWSPPFVVFGECYGEATAMAFRDDNHVIYEATAMLPASQWVRAADSFSNWLDKLADSGGQKWW